MPYTSQLIRYASSDASAPVINGQTGSLLAALDAVLVTGYGSKPPAGWSKPFINTGSLGCIKQGTGSMCYLAINDVGPGAAGGAEARLSGWRYMTDTQSGSRAFPGDPVGGGLGTYLVARKSATADATARDWIMFADSSSVYSFIKSGDFASVTYNGFYFGDITGIAENNPLKCLIIGRTIENSSSFTHERLDNLTTSMSLSSSGHFSADSFTGLSGSYMRAGKHGGGTKGSFVSLSGSAPYPNLVDGKLYLSPVWVHEPPSNGLRGTMRGFWQVLHATSSFPDGTTFSGSAGSYLDGKIFEIIHRSPNGSIYCMETSNTITSN